MKKLVLYIISLFVLASCATVPLEITENDDHLRMIGGKEALLDAIVYPEPALSKGIEGIVTVLAYVDTSGEVRDCKIIEGNEFLNEAAVAAMMKQRFHPYILEGKKRPVRVAIPISFSIAKDIDVYDFEKARVKTMTATFMNEPVLTIDMYPPDRSTGGKNDYYSEAKTWWPKPDNPTAPYMIKEGENNPEAFTKHEELLERMNEIVSGLTSAYLITGKKEYALKAVEHIKAWFVEPATRMNPHFKFAQAIPYRNPGRMVGIMDALPLVETFRSIMYLKEFLTEKELIAFDNWMNDYGQYLEFDDNMQIAMQRKDNYALAWFLQMASVAAHKINVPEEMDRTRYYFKEHINKFINDGNSNYYHMNTNRHYTHNIFMASDMLAVALELISDKTYSAWNEVTGGIKRPGDMVNYLFSGILNYDLKLAGYYDGRFNALLLAGKAYENSRYLEMWRDLNTGKTETTAFPIREVVLWVK